MSRIPGSRVIAFATWLLALLGAGLMYVSFDAQYRFILAQKDAKVPSLIEAAMLDAQAGTGRTYIAEELRKLTKLALTCGPAEEDDGQPAG